MRRLIFFIFIFYALACEGQILRTNSFYVAPAGGFCAEYQAVYNAYTDSPGADTADVLNTFVVNAKAHGYWAKGDLIYFTASKNAADGCLNWINPTGDDNLTIVSECVHTQWEGFAGDGSADYLSTNYNPSSEAVNYTQDAATIGTYLRLDKNETKVSIAAVDGSSNNALIFPRDGGNFGLRLNDAGTKSGAVANSLGLFVGTRPNATNVERHKGSTHYGDEALNSTGIPNDVFEILARNGGLLSTNQVSFVYVGGLLTDQEITDMNTDVETVMDYFGKGVQ